MTLSKQDLVVQIAGRLGISQSDVRCIVEATLDVISDGLAHGHRWELRGFGVLEVKTRAARTARNPHTGEEVPLPERRSVRFRPGKKMREMVTNP